MRRVKKDKSIKFYRQLFINFILVFLFVFLPFVFAIYMNGQNYMREIKDYEYQTNLDMGYKTQAVFDSVLNSVNISMKNLWSEKAIGDFIACREPDKTDPRSVQAMSVLQGALLSEEYVKNIQIYSKTSQILIDSKNGFYKKGKDQKFWSSFEWFNLMENYGDKPLNVIANNGVVWKIEPGSDTNGNSGYIAFEIDFKTLAEWLISQDETFKKKDFIIINDYGEILYYNGANNLYRNVVEGLDCSYSILSSKPNSVSEINMLGRNVMLARIDSNDGDWIYAIVDHADVSAKIMDKTVNVTRITFVSTFLICVLSVLLITAFTYSPILRIVHMFTKQSDVSPDTVEKQGNRRKIFFNETAYIINSMLHLLKNNKNMEKELEQRIELLNKSQAQVLQIQTDPHFLYNSLDTIRWASIEEFGNNNDTCKMIEKLSLLYRQYFRTDNTIVTVREEIEMLNMYISIINIRFENRIKFSINIPKELLDTQCLKMCLQPIVENSIQHGLRPLGYRGEIHVSLRKLPNSDLEFCVMDTGKGLTSSEIAIKNQELSNRNNQISTHIGLLNVNERIKLLYGDEYGVRVQASGTHHGLTVYIKFPSK